MSEQTGRKQKTVQKISVRWKYLKNKLKQSGSQVVSATTQLKLMASDGKMRLSDVIDADGIVALVGEFPANIGAKFLKWFTYSDDVEGENDA